LIREADRPVFPYCRSKVVNLLPAPFLPSNSKILELMRTTNPACNSPFNLEISLDFPLKPRIGVPVGDTVLGVIGKQEKARLA
jgi:hypothetical protein